ncbi:MAG: glycoside hydrolase family 3 protein [Porphyrobacter sp.]|nr:glycoside hydrolase family 3 protein [Porphyrobacter sp.]
MKSLQAGLAAAAAAVLMAGACAPARETSVTLARDTKGTPAERAAAMLRQMTEAEKLTLLEGYFATGRGTFSPPEGARQGSAGYVPGIPRLGIPPQWQTDAGLGVASQGAAKHKRVATALPSGVATAATFDPTLAYEGGRMIGGEARAYGFNVMLGGGADLLREPRNGRNFEYAGEDPLLAGTIVGAEIAGVQSAHVIDTTKHYALNDQETDRGIGNFKIDEAGFRMSDLLAFELAIEGGHPGSVMCAYNLVNDLHACESPFLLTQVLRNDWDWPGYVMSDWGAAHSTAASAEAGLDQESGYGLQMNAWFGADKLEAALAKGEIDQARIDLMVTRILTAMFAHGLIDDPVTGTGPIDFAADGAVSQRDAEAGIVLLKNDGNLLPIAATAKRIVVIGGHADEGVLSGGGSSQVYPEGENAVPGIPPTSWPGPVVYYPSAPLDYLLLPGATINYVGDDPVVAAALARDADLVIVFGTQWASESIDVPLHLDGAQDALIEAVAAANPRTVVVLETGGPVLMPWADKVPAILEAWYPGRMGGAAIANVLTGKVNPSGRLPMTFPKSLDQLPYPAEPRKKEATYTEGATVGYKWFDAKGLTPQFPFGHGLSYTRFAYSNLKVKRAGQGLVASVTVTNTGDRAGGDAVQVYVSGRGWEAPKRLGGFAKVQLWPGHSTTVQIPVDPRLLAVWDTAHPGWSRAAGAYTVTVAHSSRDLGQSVKVELPASHLSPRWKP